MGFLCYINAKIEKIKLSPQQLLLIGSLEFWQCHIPMFSPMTGPLRSVKLTIPHLVIPSHHPKVNFSSNLFAHVYLSQCAALPWPFTLLLPSLYLTLLWAWNSHFTVVKLYAESLPTSWLSLENGFPSRTLLQPSWMVVVAVLYSLFQLSLAA